MGFHQGQVFADQPFAGTPCVDLQVLDAASACFLDSKHLVGTELVHLDVEVAAVVVAAAEADAESPNLQFAAAHFHLALVHHLHGVVADAACVGAAACAEVADQVAVAPFQGILRGNAWQNEDS
jgi:hypothetical protein